MKKRMHFQYLSKKNSLSIVLFSHERDVFFFFILHQHPFPTFSKRKIFKSSIIFLEDQLLDFLDFLLK